MDDEIKKAKSFTSTSPEFKRTWWERARKQIRKFMEVMSMPITQDPMKGIFDNKDNKKGSK